MGKDIVMEHKETQQSPAMHAEPRNEHKWLHKLVGEWTYEGEATMEPGQPAVPFKGIENVRSIGGLWIVAEGKGEMPEGGEATMIMTLGFDPYKQRYSGTWIGSMMTHLWVYDGELDAAQRVLTLHSQGPDMAVEGKMATYKDVIEFKGDNQRVLTAHMLDNDGKWHKLMTAEYRLRK
jgi:hypothetical protein